MKEKQHNLATYLENQTIEETIEVLDEVLSVLVIHTEHVGLHDQFSHQYLTIKALRDLFLALMDS